MIRAGRPVPSDRFSVSPHLSLAAAIISRDEAEELVASLEAFVDAPLTVQYLAQWATVRCVIFSGHLDLVAEPLCAFEQLVEQMQSVNATGGIAELRGHLAVATGDWTGAAEWFAEAAASQEVERPNWFRLAVASHALTARAIVGLPITGADIGDPWRDSLAPSRPLGSTFSRRANAMTSRPWSIKSSPSPTNLIGAPLTR